MPVVNRPGPDPVPASPAVLGRESELLGIHRFLESGRPVTWLVLTGEAGIGKTTLWEAGLEFARELGYRVLAARTSQAEVSLPFAVLADLLDEIGPEVLGSLPGPQLHA